ncbi:UvrD-helicase domain-containing protein [Treponema phagedenis]|uniref:DNA 3'-5' helicase n=1 Tax=Treponema phagedenis TaxID=162 RepID=A0AAE6IS36_TREPH|nr:UvrD-helicase domain-containing protein [Treponema phagedenis]QEJ97236.1 AAA family ATPase [Treponema phagedenis]
MSDFIESLNQNQKAAALIDVNAVISAGAGSGKTRVLTARYIHLVINKKIPVEKIVALTFTKKAAAEMYQRIYRELLTCDSPEAKQAINSFHLARIMTIDSFSLAVARTGCKNFGISPDFSIDKNAGDLLAEQIALDFFLKHRNNKSLQTFMGESNIETFAQELFGTLLSEHIFVSSPIDFQKKLRLQLEKTKESFRYAADEARRVLQELDLLCSKADFNNNAIKKCKLILDSVFQNNYDFSGDDCAEYLHKLEQLFVIKGNLGGSNLAAAECRSIIKNEIRERIYPKLLNSYALLGHQADIEELFKLFEEIQAEYIQKKKETGTLNYGDVAMLARDVLLHYPDIRHFYKQDISAIMIDEFQDNNILQKELLYLLAERENWETPAIPASEELSEGKLFFVGDEKQSIYAFRGADVAVFRQLSYDLHADSYRTKTSLDTNYRTETGLLDFFNRIFSLVFYSHRNKPDSGIVPTFEAEFFPIGTARHTEGVEPKIELFGVDKHRLENYQRFEDTLDDLDDLDGSSEGSEEAGTTLYLTPREAEAFRLAKRIKELYEDKTPVRHKDEKARPCRWADFAILMRATTNQQIFERFLRAEGIPYRSVQQKGLFFDAPINDIYALLQLALLPSDRQSYAQVLRSPFVHLDDRSFTIIMLNNAEPFSADMDSLLEDEARNRFEQGRALYERVQNYLKSYSNAELVTKLWYDEAYRYILLTNPEYHSYLDLYDYFFEAARLADEQHIAISDFVANIRSYAENLEKPDEMEIPFEGDNDAVQIMSVHKSKGLEFPIVCIPSCDYKGIPIKKDGKFYFSDEYSVAMHLPPVKGFEGNPENIFYTEMKEELGQKQVAEAKRLLYVALTRAECRLIISGTLPIAAKEDQYTENVQRSFEEIKKFFTEQNPNSSTRSFFSLLLSAIANDILAEKEPVFSFEEILPIERKTVTSQIPQSRKTDYAAVYRKLQIKPAHRLTEKPVTAVTGLEKDSRWTNAREQEPPAMSGSDLSAADIGSLAHKAIEAYFLQRDISIPEKLKKEIHTMRDTFFNSELGKKALAAQLRKTEYGFITRLENKLVAGQIDLLFEADNCIYIVDYKTDSVINPENHRLQLQVYKKAVDDLCRIKHAEQKPIRLVLFYLRHAQAVEVTEP